MIEKSVERAFRRPDDRHSCVASSEPDPVLAIDPGARRLRFGGEVGHDREAAWPGLAFDAEAGAQPVALAGFAGKPESAQTENLARDVAASGFQPANRFDPADKIHAVPEVVGGVATESRLRIGFQNGLSSARETAAFP